MKHRDPNARLARNFMEHVWLERVQEGLDEFLSHQILVKSPLKQSVGVDTLTNAFSVWFRGFPNLSYREKKFNISNDKVDIEWEVEGNHLGEFFGFSPTGKPIQYSGTTELVMFDGRIQTYSADVQIGAVIEQISSHTPIVVENVSDDTYIRLNHILGLSLTKRQIDCLALNCLRCDNTLILSKLNIKYTTFRTHIERILPTLGLTSRKDIFDWAMSNHILELLIHIGLEKLHSTDPEKI